MRVCVILRLLITHIADRGWANYICSHACPFHIAKLNLPFDMDVISHASIIHTKSSSFPMAVRRPFDLPAVKFMGCPISDLATFAAIAREAAAGTLQHFVREPSLQGLMKW